MEVAAIARNISRALQLNEDLTETIALATISATPPSATKARRPSTD